MGYDIMEYVGQVAMEDIFQGDTHHIRIFVVHICIHTAHIYLSLYIYIYIYIYSCLHSEIPNQYLWLVVSILLISLIFNHRIGMMFIDDSNGNRFIQTMVAVMRGHLFLSPQIGCGFGDLDGFGSSFLLLDIHDIRADQLTNSINFQNTLGRPMAWLQHFWLSNSLCFWWCVSIEFISKSKPDHQSKELQWNMFLCWGQSWVDIMDYSCPILWSRPVSSKIGTLGITRIQ